MCSFRRGVHCQYGGIVLQTVSNLGPGFVKRPLPNKGSRYSGLTRKTGMKSKLSHSQHEGGMKHLVIGISLTLSIHGENTAGGPVVKEKNIVLLPFQIHLRLCPIGGG